MYTLGIDLGTSSVKVTLLNCTLLTEVASAHFPEQEAPIHVQNPGWAEQNPLDWWQYTQAAILKLKASHAKALQEVKAIGIAYQMHGLVTVDKAQKSLRNSIIWCDSRAVPYGQQAYQAIGAEKALAHLLNTPGNFTAAKLAWVKENEPKIFNKIDKVMLPGDFIAMMLSGSITTSISALSEGVFWDFKSNTLSTDVMNYFGFSDTIIPPVHDLFSTHGLLKPEIAHQLGLNPHIPISYKAGDQPNNALSLNVLQPGQVAATAGTSGVIYAVGNQLVYDQASRINTFAHVNYQPTDIKTGVLLCINGVGSMYRWAKQQFAPTLSYPQVNQLAAKAPIGSKGLQVLPFGNGAERMLENRYTGAQLKNIDLNLHHQPEIFRAVTEGIAFAFRYGMDVMRENSIHPQSINAGLGNLFQSPVFAQIFADVTHTPLNLYKTDGGMGAAIGAALGAGIFKNADEAFQKHQALQTIQPQNTDAYENLYQDWKTTLQKELNP